MVASAPALSFPDGNCHSIIQRLLYNAAGFGTEFPHKPMPPRVAMLACSVFEQEIAMLTQGASHIVETRFYEIALHDRPDVLRAQTPGGTGRHRRARQHRSSDPRIRSLRPGDGGTPGRQPPVRDSAGTRLHHRVSRQQGGIRPAPARLPDLLLLHPRVEPGTAGARPRKRLRP